MLRVAFMGSPAFAVPCLAALREHAEIVLVVTQPDQPSGRGRALAPTAVKVAALEAGLRVETPPSLRKPEPYARSLAGLDLDLIVVVAYGKILPADLLAVPRHGCWNVHASLLPRHRGAAPVQWSLVEGDRETGVTLMQMDEGLDTGPILLQRSIAVDSDDTAGTLLDKLAPLGAEILVEGIAKLVDKTLVATPQDARQMTLAPLLEKESGRVDWTLPARGVAGRIRGLDPWPGAFTLLDGESLKLWGARVVGGDLAVGSTQLAAPGTVLGASKKGLLVACGDGAITVGDLQLPGRKRMPTAALIAGRPIPDGTVLGK